MRGGEPFLKRYYRLQKTEIAWLRFILESYDGLAFVSTLDNREALVEVAYPPSRRADAEALLDDLCTQSGMQSVSAPPQAERPTQES